MKVMTVVCKQCGYEKRIEIYSREEANKKRIRIDPPKCDKCGSPNVQLP